MDFTETQLENIADHLRSAGFDFEDAWDNDMLALMATCVLEALGLNVP